MSGGGGCGERRLLVSRTVGSGSARELFVLPAGGGWALPRLDGEPRRAADVDDVAPLTRDRFGLHASVLRCVRDAPPGPDGVRRQAFELEAHAAGAAPGDGQGRWLRAEALGGAAFGDAEDHALVARWLGGMAGPASARQLGDWEQAGWWAHALGWAQTELSRRGLGEIVEAAQVRVWEFSHVLRLRTGAGEFYLKARPASGGVELRLTVHLAASHPGALPEVVALEAGRHWLLMRAAAGPALMDVGDLSSWAAAARALAAIQIDWIGRVAELAALGCPERPLEGLVEEVEPLLADRAALQPEDPEALTEGEIESLRRHASTIRARCLELVSLGVPPSLEHGDCWAANVIVADHGPVIIDWEDAAIGHPFLSLFLLTTSVDCASALANAGRARDVIEAAYRAAWQERGPLAGWPGGRLARALALSQIVAPLHYAALFRHGLSQVETSWEVRGYCPYFLRLLLRAITAR